MNNLRTDCPMRHENGNCTVAGGFCTAVNDQICEALHHAYDFGYKESLSRDEIVSDTQKPLTLDELRTMAGEPVWCSEYQYYGIIEIETIGRWANTPLLVGVWHDRGVAGKFEYDIKKRRLTLFRSKPESPKGERNETNPI